MERNENSETGEEEEESNSDEEEERKSDQSYDFLNENVGQLKLNPSSEKISEDDINDEDQISTIR